MRPPRHAAAAAILLALGGPVLAQEAEVGGNDFPTEARAEYVFACMAANGQNQDLLRRCSCSIDVIATILPYDRYVAAETVLTMRQITGERVGMMRTAPAANAMVQDLKRAQAEGEIRCF